jgi:ferredoxin, 2Fe-2S
MRQARADRSGRPFRSGSGVAVMSDLGSVEAGGRVTVTDRSGREHEVAFDNGMSLMQVSRNAGITDILALCGGCASCATCHVFVDEEWMERVGPPAGDELDLLETSIYESDHSRLSCQIELTERLSGLRVTVAPEE